jgi:DNA-binding transcriptional LysR family regulator
LDIRHLEYFVEVTRHKSFSKAAETIHVSQSTISKMVRNLEDELGKPLFNRSSKYVQLTDTGEALFSKAQQIVELFHSIPAELDSLSEVEKGKINIGLPPITGASIFAKLLGEFKTAYPNIDIVLFEHGSKSVEVGVQDGSLDAGLICCPANNDLYDVIHFSKDPLRIVTHAGHPLSRYERVSFESLANESFVLYRQDFSLHEQIVRRCNLAGFQPKIIVETSQRELMLQIVANKMGITLLPGNICKELDPNTLASVPFDDPQIYLELSLIWNSKRYLSYATHLWLKFVQDNILSPSEST